MRGAVLIVEKVFGVKGFLVVVVNLVRACDTGLSA